jgi:3-oxoacyl-[acyl-carrier-protein] synthase-3
MALSPIAILGTGAYAPNRVLTNEELAQRVETSHDWIVSRTGIRERRVADPGQTTADLATEAAREALANAQITPQEVDLLILATVTPDLDMPATACLVQQKLGIPSGAACFDLNAACTGFLYALDVAWAMLSSGRYRHALVIGAERLSSVLDWEDRTTCVLFGDGAGAVVLGASRRPGSAILASRLHSVAGTADLLHIPGATFSLDPADPKRVIRMKGKEVFKLAVRAMEDVARELLEQQGVSGDQIDCIIPHQANQRIIDSIAQYLKLPLDRFFINLDRYGNTSAASIPIALHEARMQGRVQPGQLVLMVAFGAGLTYGGALVRW